MIVNTSERWSLYSHQTNETFWFIRWCSCYQLCNYDSWSCFGKFKLLSSKACRLKTRLWSNSIRMTSSPPTQPSSQRKERKGLGKFWPTDYPRPELTGRPIEQSASLKPWKRGWEVYKTWREIQGTLSECYRSPYKTFRQDKPKWINLIMVRKS